MKNICYTKLLLFAIMVLAFMSCDQDDSVPNTPLENTTKAEIVEESITVSEGTSVEFTIAQENLVEGKIDPWEGIFVYDEPISGQIGLRVVGGTATQGVDYIFNNYNWDTDEGNYYFMTVQDFSPFLFQDGYIYTYDASTSLENTISDFLTIVDDGIPEGSETIELQLFPVALGYIVIDDTIEITITD